MVISAKPIENVSIPAGTRVEDLDTPAVLIDLTRLERNIEKWQADMKATAGVKFRPHIKTHKIPEIAHLQLAAGAIGIASAKVSEAEPFGSGDPGYLLSISDYGCAEVAQSRRPRAERRPHDSELRP